MTIRVVFVGAGTVEYLDKQVSYDQNGRLVVTVNGERTLFSDTAWTSITEVRDERREKPTEDAPKQEKSPFDFIQEEWMRRHGNDDSA